MGTPRSPLLGPMRSSPAMRAVCDDVAYLQHMLDFEAALARAEAATSVIPASAVAPIEKACKAGMFDIAALAEAATRSGNLAIPLVNALTAEVAKADAAAPGYVHWGATSQDVIDTATMLTLRAAIDALLVDIDRAATGFAKLARQHRDRMAEAASVFAIVAGTCGKIARDVSLMMQTDVAEAFEPSGEGRGGSSTMPHKRNPVAAATALAAATMAPNLAATMFAAQVQDHERSAGPWHAEWPTLPNLQLVTSGALAAIVDLAEGLEVDVSRMRANLDATHGLIMAEAVTFALAESIGKSDAHHLVEAAAKKAGAGKQHLRDVL